MMLKGLGGKEKAIEPRHRQDLDLLKVQDHGASRFSIL